MSVSRAFVRRRLLFVLLGIVVAPISGQSGQNSTSDVRADRTEIRFGEAAVLSWSLPPTVDGGFLTGFGRVPPSGNRQVLPAEDTTYFLVTESAAGVRRSEVTIKVSNQRSPTEFPSDEDPGYAHPLRVMVGSSSLPSLLARVEGLLQNEMRFYVRQLRFRDFGVRFVTALSERPELVKKEERIGSRRLSYRIDVEPAGTGVPPELTVRTMVQYRLARERTWRLDEDERTHRDAADDFSRRVTATRKGGQ